MRKPAKRDGAHWVRHWLMAHADVQKLWWPQQLLAGTEGAGQDAVARQVGEAESMVIDHLLGWRSIVPTYGAIFDFDLEDALRRIVSPTQVLELRPAEEAHMPAQAPRICDMIAGSQSVLLQDCDANVFRHEPERVAQAVLPFLKDGEPR